MELSTTGPNKRFEDIKHIDENGVEFWSAREMFPLFGYSTWQAFDDVVARAIKSAVNAGQIAENHFSQLTKLVEMCSWDSGLTPTPSAFSTPLQARNGLLFFE